MPLGKPALSHALCSKFRADDWTEPAYQAAARQMKEAGNVHRYKEVFGSSGSNSGSNTNSGNSVAVRNHIVYDTAWVHDAEMNNRTGRDILTSRLQAAQAHLNKEAIRAAYLAMAEHDAMTGDLTEAFHSVLRAKDYCTSRQQTGRDRRGRRVAGRTQ
jgi:hypothetical protein